MPFTSYYLSPEGEIRSKLSNEEIKAAFKSNQGLLWVDVGDTTEEDGRFLEQTFGFHPLAVEDCVKEALDKETLEVYGMLYDLGTGKVKCLSKNGIPYSGGLK